jgi:putative transposase
LIAAALEPEVDEYDSSFTDELDQDGQRLVVRNGRARERKLTVWSGTVPVRARRVNDKRIDEETEERKRFSSRILPAYARRSPRVTEVLPILYLHEFPVVVEGVVVELRIDDRRHPRHSHRR